jgi:hypothetical protein
MKSTDSWRSVENILIANPFYLVAKYLGGAGHVFGDDN